MTEEDAPIISDESDADEEYVSSSDDETFDEMIKRKQQEIWERE